MANTLQNSSKAVIFLYALPRCHCCIYKILFLVQELTQAQNFTKSHPQLVQ